MPGIGFRSSRNLKGVQLILPRIGVTMERRLSPAGSWLLAIPEAYIQSIVQAGAAPLLIPPDLPEETLESLLTALDGILFTGGGDIQPELYGAGPHPKLGEVDAGRDQVELQLLQAAVKEEKPFLGICRGLQLVNVGLGGTLYADIAEQRPDALKHDYYPGFPRDYLAHSVAVHPGSRLAEILDHLHVNVNSLHHQAIRQLAHGLQATAHAPDGLVEAIELRDHPFGLAVQWHPECLPDDPAMCRLFSALALAARSEKHDG